MSTAELTQEQEIPVGGLQINGETPSVSKDIIENIAAGGFNMYGLAKVGLEQAEARKVTIVRHSDSSVLASVISDALGRGDKVTSHARKESQGHVLVKNTSFRKIGPVLFGSCKVEHIYTAPDLRDPAQARSLRAFFSVGPFGLKNALGIEKTN